MDTFQLAGELGMRLVCLDDGLFGGTLLQAQGELPKGYASFDF